MDLIRLAILLVATSLMSAPAMAGIMNPFEMRGLRSFGGPPLVLDFSAVKAVTEDRTIAHFDTNSFSGSAAGATLTIGINNIDAGAPDGTLDVYAFAGDGVVSPDEWDAGALFHTFGGIQGSYSTLTVDVSALLASALASGDDYLSFNFRTVDTDRYWLNSTIGGVVRSISGEGPTFIDVPDGGVPAPSIIALFAAALWALGLVRRRRSIS